MSFSMAGGGARGPEINVTPLIDVLLTLIIVFMVVVSMDKEQGENAQIPQPDQKQTAEQEQITHRRHSGGVDEGKSASNSEDQSGRRALGRFGTAARENLLNSRRKSGLRTRRCRCRLPIRGGCNRCGASRGVDRVGLLTMDRGVRGRIGRPETFNFSPDS